VTNVLKHSLQVAMAGLIDTENLQKLKPPPTLPTLRHRRRRRRRRLTSRSGPGAPGAWPAGAVVAAPPPPSSPPPRAVCGQNHGPARAPCAAVRHDSAAAVVQPSAAVHASAALQVARSKK